MTATRATQQPFGKEYAGSGPENYERYFVPSIGQPLADDLLQRAALRPGERVLDVACGTGIVTRLAAERVAPGGTVAGLDANAGMLEVARRATASITPPIRWYETSAETIPLPNDAFDVVLCQLGAQFFEDKEAAVRQMQRVLVPAGRLYLSVPGASPFFDVLHDVIERHLSPEAASFVSVVFSLYDADRVKALLNDAGFRAAAIESYEKTLPLPGPADFLWQYINSTPLMAAVSELDDKRRSAIERDAVVGWQKWTTNGAMSYGQPMMVASGRK